MLKYMLIPLVIGTGFLNAGNVQNIEILEAEKRALELKLEAYSLKKKIIELENFFEKDKMKKEERIERERALIQLKHDLAVNSAKRNETIHYYAG